MARVNVQWRRRRRLLGAITCFAVGAVLLITGLVTTHDVIVIGVTGLGTLQQAIRRQVSAVLVGVFVVVTLVRGDGLNSG